MAVKVIGVRDTLRELNKFQPKLVKAMRKEINNAAGIVRQKARGYVPTESPLSGWTATSSKTGRWAERSFDTGFIRQNIKTTRGIEKQGRGAYAYELRVSNLSPAGVIYEGAGTIHPTGEDRTHGNRGKRFVEAIGNSGLRIPLHRLVVRAGVEVGPQARKMYEAAVKKVEAAVQRQVS